ncbi:hypothetical protein [Microcystis phage Mel-JY01]
MELSTKILSDITVFMKYAKYIPTLRRRETWAEMVTRNKEMHIRKYPHIKDEIESAYTYVYDKKVLPSMRSLQFGGRPIELSPNRLYNCCFLTMDTIQAFSEIMFLLLGGTGVGYSVQKHHVDKLPKIKKPTKKQRRYLVSDSIEGWADAIKVLIKSYFNGTATIQFDYSDIRPKGAMLITSGGKAPGPEPLRECVEKIRTLLDKFSTGDVLKPIDVHDINCHIADAVLAGGIRRAAMISLFSIDDEEMISCKYGDWYVENGQRGRANNSAVLNRNSITQEQFMDLWKKIELSQSGEPGVYFTNDMEAGTNPCCEIALNNMQFCNLTEINASDVVSQEDLNNRTRAAAFIGTLQAGYTDFHYLRPGWKKITEDEALLGVSLTGIASGKIFSLDSTQAARIATEENERVAKLIGINKAARVTTIKPAGTTSLTLGCSSGIHAWHNDYYIRRIRVGKNESIYGYLKNNHPELITDELARPQTTAVIEIPQKAPDGSILRTESPMQLLERIKTFYQNWVTPGHRYGANTHNISATVSIKDDEWEIVGKWMWENKEYYNGISVLPYFGGTYPQTPFEDITKEKYEELVKSLTNIDLSKIVEVEDNTDLSGEAACAGGSCEIR